MNRDELKAAAERLLREMAVHRETEPDEYDRMTADIEAVANAVLADGWQPIETAPKDGTRVLVYGPYETLPDEPYVTIGHWAGRWWVGGVRYSPTHWMPLPEPPHAPA